MASPPFKVKAIYDYNSGHEDDLSFAESTIITVTAEEDADWYIGEYTAPNGGKQEGLFPKNFVERFEPAPPPRPTRTARPPPPPEAPSASEQQSVEDAPSNAPSSQPEPQEQSPVIPQAPAPEPVKAEAPKPPMSPPPVSSQEQPPVPKASKPPPATTSTSSGSKSPPPVAEKPQSFKDRIAAFNKAAAPPPKPFKPVGPSTGFIKKPFVAPPPSRDAYVPPPREAAPQKIYRRDEDPEIAERQAQDQESAEKAGLAGSASAEPEGEEDQPKPTSLKERIALLQKQQMEQAARQAERQTEKPKRPPKKRVESHETEPLSETTEGGDPEEANAAKKRHPHVPKAAEPRLSEPLSDGNEADQSAAGETTEDAEGLSTSIEDDEDKSRAKAAAISAPRAPAAPVHEPEVGDEEDAAEEDEEEEEEEEMDEETRRRMELRERMAKMSGGMGMAGMFGPPGGMPMPGMKPPKKSGSGSERKSTESRREVEQSPPPPAQRVPMIPIPGMPHPAVRSPDSEGTELAVEKEEETSHPVTDKYSAEEVPDVEDVRSEASHKGHPQERIPHAHEAAAVSPISPSDRAAPLPPLETRPVPPPVPPTAPTRHDESDELDDEDTEAPKELPVRGPPPPVPQSPPPPHSAEPTSPHVPSRPSTGSEKRSSRAVPPIPMGSPIVSPIHSRAPPPPPPGAPPSKASTDDTLSPGLHAQREEEGETDYEGDYDTDIASTATHKDALKAHLRDQSQDDSTLAGDTPVRSPVTGPPPVPLGTAPRAFPPPPPQEPPRSRASIDAPRGAPPPPPTRESLDLHRAVPPPLPRESLDAPRTAPPPLPRDAKSPMEEDEYDPFKPGAGARAPQPPPVPPPAAREPATPAEEAEEDELYASPPPRRMSQRMSRHAVPPPPPPHQEIPESVVPNSPGRASMQASRRSVDVDRAIGSRRSMDQARPSMDHGQIANDVDLGHGSKWWSQPNTPPPVFQNRKDVLFEIEESTTTKRGGRAIVQKDVYILFQDYSQTVVTARYYSHDQDQASLEQRHEAPPPKLRQDQLEAAYEHFGRRIADEVNNKKDTVVGDGSPQALVLDLLAPFNDALMPIGTRAYGALVYANLGNASVQQYDEIRPGDIISLRNAKFQGKHGTMHAKYSMDVGKPDHVGVVIEWDGTKKKIRAYEQGRENKKVKAESFRMADLRSGEVRVWRVMGRDWVGWDSAH
ncbi:SH3 domain protein [Phyllosticta capitalensis]